jgi:hypothetical protein
LETLRDDQAAYIVEVAGPFKPEYYTDTRNIFDLIIEASV